MGARHWNPDKHVTVIADQLMETSSLPAKDHDGRRVELDLIVILLSPFIEPVNPETPLFQILQRARNIANSYNRHVFQGSRRRFCDGFGESGCPALGNNDGRRSGGVRRAHDRAEIMRVFHAIE